MQPSPVDIIPGNEPQLQRPVARVFFQYERDRLVAMRGLPLGNHLENVATLARHWDFEVAFGSNQCPPGLSATRFWLIEAARRHDEGKARRFYLRKDERYGLTYSFSGHRFDVSDERLYVQWLIRLHHGFGVHDVTEAQALLKQSGDARLAAAAECFPLDLYALEMCDQIEAEAASRAFANAGPPRAFMEFDIQDLPGEGGVRMGLFPYPFREPEVRFTFQSFVVDVPTQVQPTESALKQILLTGRIAGEERKEVRLCSVE
jgi:hypothetical protein